MDGGWTAPVFSLWRDWNGNQRRRLIAFPKGFLACISYFVFLCSLRVSIGFVSLAGIQVSRAILEMQRWALCVHVFGVLGVCIVRLVEQRNVSRGRRQSVKATKVFFYLNPVPLSHNHLMLTSGTEYFGKSMCLSVCVVCCLLSVWENTSQFFAEHFRFSLCGGHYGVNNVERREGMTIQWILNNRSCIRSLSLACIVAARSHDYPQVCVSWWSSCACCDFIWRALLYLTSLRHDSKAQRTSASAAMR